jgi:hypothetical protein
VCAFRDVGQTLTIIMDRASSSPHFLCFILFLCFSFSLFLSLFVSLSLFLSFSLPFVLSFSLEISLSLSLSLFSSFLSFSLPFFLSFFLASINNAIYDSHIFGSIGYIGHALLDFKQNSVFRHVGRPGPSCFACTCMLSISVATLMLVLIYLYSYCAYTVRRSF